MIDTPAVALAFESTNTNETKNQFCAPHETIYSCFESAPVLELEPRPLDGALEPRRH